MNFIIKDLKGNKILQPFSLDIIKRNLPQLIHNLLKVELSYENVYNDLTIIKVIGIYVIKKDNRFRIFKDKYVERVNKHPLMDISYNDIVYRKLINDLVDNLEMFRDMRITPKEIRLISDKYEEGKNVYKFEM